MTQLKVSIPAPQYHLWQRVQCSEEGYIGRIVGMEYTSPQVTQKLGFEDDSSGWWYTLELDANSVGAIDGIKILGEEDLELLAGQDGRKPRPTPLNTLQLDLHLLVGRYTLPEVIDRLHSLVEGRSRLCEVEGLVKDWDRVVKALEEATQAALVLVAHLQEGDREEWE
jgi:hypothetical protein